MNVFINSDSFFVLILQLKVNKMGLKNNVALLQKPSSIHKNQLQIDLQYTISVFSTGSVGQMRISEWTNMRVDIGSFLR